MAKIGPVSTVLIRIRSEEEGLGTESPTCNTRINALSISIIWVRIVDKPLDSIVAKGRLDLGRDCVWYFSSTYRFFFQMIGHVLSFSSAPLSFNAFSLSSSMAFPSRGY